MIRVGTCGWQYAGWRHRFYPDDVPQRLWLEYYAGAFDTVEVDNAFYRLPERDTFAAWRDRTPDDFLVAVKMSRFLTHVKRLRDPAEPVGRFLERATGLADKLGPVLLQLPPTLAVDVDRLDAVLDECDKGAIRVVVEPRHSSWWTDSVRDVLGRHDAALCWSDRLGQPVTPLWRTAPFGYLRLHGLGATRSPRYDARTLRLWAKRIRSAYPSDSDVFVYFNNDADAAAAADASAFVSIAAEQSTTVEPSTTAEPSNSAERRARAA